MNEQSENAQAGNTQSLAELLEETRAGNRLLKKQLMFSRLSVLALIALVLVLGVFLSSAMAEVRSVTAVVAELDLQRVSSAIAALDVQSLNEAIAELKTQVAGLDTDALNKAMTALTDAAEEISGAAETFNRMTSFFR